MKMIIRTNGKFKKTETTIDGVYIIEPTVFGDNRGYFMETYSKKDFEELEIVVWYNPEAGTYYHNKIFDLSKGATPIYSSSINNQLKKFFFKKAQRETIPFFFTLNLLYFVHKFITILSIFAYPNNIA